MIFHNRHRSTVEHETEVGTGQDDDGGWKDRREGWNIYVDNHATTQQQKYFDEGCTYAYAAKNRQVQLHWLHPL